MHLNTNKSYNYKLSFSYCLKNEINEQKPKRNINVFILGYFVLLFGLVLIFLHILSSLWKL